MSEKCKAPASTGVNSCLRKQESCGTLNLASFVGGIDMFWFLRGRTCPIGVDMGRDSLKLAQLGNNVRGIHLIAGVIENRPADVEPGSADWQRWAIEAIKRLIAKGRFLAAVMLI